MTVALTGALILLFGSVKVFVWVNERIVSRQQSYEATRVGSGQLTEPTQPLNLFVVAVPLNADALFEAARQLLRTSTATFSLFDFTQGLAIDHLVSDIIDTLTQQEVPITVDSLTGAIAQFDPATGAITFDSAWLRRATPEMIAAVLAHEGWHVVQFSSGVLDDFVHYPRQVDIEYEAFVAEAAEWNAAKGSQTDPIEEAGAACVAAGEARCKEILATDFGYATTPRGPNIG